MFISQTQLIVEGMSWAVQPYNRGCGQSRFSFLENGMTILDIKSHMMVQDTGANPRQIVAMNTQSEKLVDSPNSSSVTTDIHNTATAKNFV
jgi:hypothetical protein